LGMEAENRVVESFRVEHVAQRIRTKAHSKK
jgi:hypothetical protein